VATAAILTEERRRTDATTPPARYRYLGSVRLLLASMVFLWHALPVFGFKSDIGATKFGPVAVFVFFVLSGFIIAEGAFTFYRNKPLAFFGNRIVRLWPPYIFAVLVMLVVLTIAPDPGFPPNTAGRIGANLFGLFPTVPLTDWIFGVKERGELLGIVWALRVEFAFYIVLAAGLCLACRPVVARWPAALAASLWAILILHAVVYHLGTPAPKLTFYLTFAPYFVLGVTVAAADHQKLKPQTALWIGVAALILSVLHALTHQVALPRTLAWRMPVTGASFVAAGLWLALTLLSAASLRHLSRVMPKRIDRLLGDLTYAVYLLHVPAIMLVDHFTESQGIPGILLAFILVLILSWACTVTVEAALRPIRQRLRGAPLPL